MRDLIKRKVFKILLCVIWLGVIFYNRTRPGEISQKSSNEIINVAKKVIKIPAVSIDEAGSKFKDVNFYIRKNAHFFQYLILGLLLCSALRQFKLNKGTEIFLMLFLLLLFPVIDELIQKYIPGRTSNITDIVIDFSGGVLAVVLSIISHKMHKEKSTVNL